IEDKEQKEFLGYLMHGKPNGNFSESVDGLVEIHRRDTQWRQGYMTWEMEMLHERNKAMQAGIEIGAVENAKRMILRGKLSPEEISEYSNLPLERIQQIAEELKLE
ncbi:MAG: hypothetical protein KBT11_09735, partial [Treponema sp.]|nr:hypothetical protein [Candidatus Treponema equifaecale]